PTRQTQVCPRPFFFFCFFPPARPPPLLPPPLKKTPLNSPLFPLFATHQNPPAALFHDTVHRGEPQSRSFRSAFRRKKRFKNMRCRFRTDSGSIVRNCQHYVASRLHRDMLAGVCLVEVRIRRLHDDSAATGHRVSRIHHEIHPPLFHLCRVGLNRSQPG